MTRGVGLQPEFVQQLLCGAVGTAKGRGDVLRSESGGVQTPEFAAVNSRPWRWLPE